MPHALPAERKIILLAGAALGIGRAVALQAAARGHALALCDLDGAALEALAGELPAGAVVMTRRADVTSLEAIAEFAEAARQRFGRIDAAICNAGGMTSLVHDGHVKTNTKPFAEVAPADWKPVIDLNLYGPMNLAHAVLPDMIARGAGRLILVSSVAGFAGSPGMAVYSAAKGAVIAFTKALAREVAGSGVRVNSVAPGAVATRAFTDNPAAIARRLERVAIGRLGEPGEIAEVILYLAADAPDYLNGETISVSGGPP